jgi:hypothetical protein
MPEERRKAEKARMKMVNERVKNALKRFLAEHPDGRLYPKWRNPAPVS